MLLVLGFMLVLLSKYLMLLVLGFMLVLLFLIISVAFYLWAPSATPTKSSYAKVAVPFIWRSRFRNDSVRRLICTLATIKLSRVSFLPLGSYLASRLETKVGLNLYPICSSACLNSPSSMKPDLSRSIRSNSPFQSLMYLNRDPNSCTLIDPDLSKSNISIIILQASSLKLLQFPLTRARCSSLASICPLLSVSTALNHCATWGSTPDWPYP